MKVVILAGGLGTRISEESVYKPKPMIEIGNMPILWHIMKEYSYYGFHDFVICAGYKQHMIKEWFADYFLHTSDITFDFTRGQNEMIVHNHHTEPWKVTVVDTGLNTMTGGRIKRIRPYIGNETFMMTYGDGVCDVDIAKLVAFHRENGKIATLTYKQALDAAAKGILEFLITDDGYLVMRSDDKLGLAQGSVSSTIDKVAKDIAEGMVTSSINMDGHLVFQSWDALGLIFEMDDEGHLIVRYNEA